MNASDEINHTDSVPSPKLGIASLALAILGTILYLLPFTLGYIAGYIAGVTGTSHPVNRMDPINIAGWFVSLCGNFLGLAALIVGSISISREKRRTFAILGIVLGTLLTFVCMAAIASNLSQR